MALNLTPPQGKLLEQRVFGDRDKKESLVKMGTGNRVDLYDRVKKMLVKAVRLKISPENIKNEQPLFGAGGLGLDSLDALELVVALEKEFGVRIPDAAVGREVLISVETIVKFIEDSNGGRSSK